jgi:hypothetical protein
LLWNIIHSNFQSVSKDILSARAIAEESVITAVGIAEQDNELFDH